MDSGNGRVEMASKDRWKCVGRFRLGSCRVLDCEIDVPTIRYELCRFHGTGRRGGRKGFIAF